MNLYILIFVLAVVSVECSHTFLGTNVLRHLDYHHNAEFSSKLLRKRVENIYFSMPTSLTNYGRTIQGILAFDLTHSGASANVTQGGLGFNFVNIRMKSDRGHKLHYDIYIYS